MSLLKMTNLAAATVALVVLIDLATGQGPPIYTNYMQAQQNFRPPQQTIGYPQPPVYPGRSEIESEFKKQEESDKFKFKDEKKFEKELKKDEEYEKQGYESTPAPGVLSSFSNSMNDAWKSISSIGRKKRAANEDKKDKATRSQQDGSPNAERSIDSYEFLQYKNQGYVYFKVPKYLVCNS